MTTPTCAAFEAHKLIAYGPLAGVALAARAALQDGRQVLVFDDSNGRVVDLDLRGDEAAVLARLSATPGADDPAPRAPGRPKLGVVPREVTLLPRHWEWLADQPGGASVTLRKLVEAARSAPDDRAAIRQAQQIADRFMSAVLGDQPGYEEASRALYAADEAQFLALSQAWPADLRDHARRLAVPAFAPPAVAPAA